MSHRVVFSPEAEEQLAELYRYIAVAASPAIAERYVNAIIAYCESLSHCPASRRSARRYPQRITHHELQRANSHCVRHR